jgi:hypothetical protein
LQPVTRGSTYCKLLKHHCVKCSISDHTQLTTQLCHNATGCLHWTLLVEVTWKIKRPELHFIAGLCEPMSNETPALVCNCDYVGNNFRYVWKWSEVGSSNLETTAEKCWSTVEAPSSMLISFVTLHPRHCVTDPFCLPGGLLKKSNKIPNCAWLFYLFIYYLVCEATGTAASPGLLCQPRVIVKTIVE